MFFVMVVCPAVSLILELMNISSLASSPHHAVKWLQKMCNSCWTLKVTLQDGENCKRIVQRRTIRITALKEGLGPLSESVTATLCMCVVSGGCCLWSEKERNNAWAHWARALPPLSISPAANGPAGRAATIKESRKSSNMSLHERRA